MVFGFVYISPAGGHAGRTDFLSGRADGMR